MKQSTDAKKICTEKFIGGIQPTIFNKTPLLAGRPNPINMPTSSDPRDVTLKSSSGGKKMKRNILDISSTKIVEKKGKKTRKSSKVESTK
ncbi:hypothetical protein OROHE_014402 [Orobanche hederae]